MMPFADTERGGIPDFPPPFRQRWGNKTGSSPASGEGGTQTILSGSTGKARSFHPGPRKSDHFLFMLEYQAFTSLVIWSPPWDFHSETNVSK